MPIAELDAVRPGTLTWFLTQRVLPDIRPSVSLKISMARTGVYGAAATELLMAFPKLALFLAHSNAKKQVQWEISVPKRRLTRM